MTKSFILTALILLLVFITVFGQKPVVPTHLYGIKDPGTESARYCNQCTQIMDNLPKEVDYGLTVADNNDVYFVISDEVYFNKLFVLPYDGIAVDIVEKDQYKCDAVNHYPNSTIYKGYLAKPSFLADIKANKTVDEDGWIYIKLFTLPVYYQKKDIELNLILLKNRYKCFYTYFYNLEATKWGLLEMGMYMDTLSEDMLKEKSHVLGKRLQIEVPFAKDKYEYAPKDIKPLYDSLRLKDFDILSIKIHAFSSVEGTTERNMELQKKRSESIMKALKSLQGLQIDSIKTEIVTAENWVDFYSDIIEGRFSNLYGLSKEEIKQKLNTDKALTTSMEPILKKHRKALIILELEPKSYTKEKDPEKIKEAFDQAIANKNIDEAMNLQREIFKRVLYNEAPENYLTKLEVPEKIEFGLVKNNLAAYKYQENVMELFETLKQFKRLQNLLPDNHRIRYNICVLQLKGWLSSEITVDQDELLNSINSLSNTPIDKRLIKRLLINYHIINSEYLMAQRKYQEKDKSLKFIFDNYAYLSLSDDDILSLAQYFVQYSQHEWAEKLTFHYAKKLQSGEDLLFYYLNLTISNPDKTAQKEYRAIMLNSINANKKRFCNMFNKNGQDGGITFQLLDDDYLKTTYCENCR